jgi:anti-sigma-K factor RskA
MTALSDDDSALAGEYVLGLLDPAESAAAQARGATDPAFAAEIEAWRGRMQSMAAGSDTPAPDHIWARIAGALPAPTSQDLGIGRLRFWKGVSFVSASAAAIMAALLYLQFYPLSPEEPMRLLIAALGSETGNAAITARYDIKSGELLLTPVSLHTGKLFPELWVIPADGKAHSLGIIATDKPTQVTVSKEMRDYLAQGATLAITPEPGGGAPGGTATGPIIASGKITTI